MIGGHVGINLDGLLSVFDFLLKIAKLAHCLAFEVEEITWFSLLGEVKSSIAGFR